MLLTLITTPIYPNCAAPVRCLADSKWPVTLGGETAKSNCICQAKPSLVEGLAATRKCLANGDWADPNEAACEMSDRLRMVCEVSEITSLKQAGE